MRMGIFTKRAVKANEELTFNYNVDRYGYVFIHHSSFITETILTITTTSYSGTRLSSAFVVKIIALDLSEERLRLI